MKNLLTSLFLLVCTAQIALASVPSRGSGIAILARGPAGLRIEGRSAEVSVDDETSALVFHVPVAPIDTGIGLRNRHLREALESDRFAEATLRVQRADLSFPTAADSVQEHSVPAELTLHGQTRPVTVRYRAAREAGATTVKGSLQIDATDFGIRLPSYLGVTVSPRVDVDLDLSLELP